MFSNIRWTRSLSLFLSLSLVHSISCSLSLSFKFNNPVLILYISTVNVLLCKNVRLFHAKWFSICIILLMIAVICHVYSHEMNEDLQMNTKMLVHIYFYLISMPPPVSGKWYAWFIVNVKHLTKVGKKNFFHRIDRLFDLIAINLLHFAHFLRTLTHFAYSNIVRKYIIWRRRRKNEKNQRNTKHMVRLDAFCCCFLFFFLFFLYKIMFLV